jgi:hypothetical protein
MVSLFFAGDASQTKYQLFHVHSSRNQRSSIRCKLSVSLWDPIFLHENDLGVSMQQGSSVPVALSITRCFSSLYVRLSLYMAVSQDPCEDLYLTRPPHDALHKPISPSKIVLAGDSAGGGLCVSVLTVLRDLGIAMPAGAVLISPCVDLTHSFPSVLQNTETVSTFYYGIYVHIWKTIGHHPSSWISCQAIHIVAH